MFNKVAIMGIGLMGGSLALAIKERNLAKKVVGFDRKGNSSATNRHQKQVVDEMASRIRIAVEDADLILMCAPVRAILNNLPLVLHYAKKEALIMDVGSTKEVSVNRAREILKKKKSFFIGAHPMAGSEKSGVEAASADLFKGKYCIISPSKGVSQETIKKAESFWSQIGSIVIIRRPDVHDAVLAKTSHLPQMVSYILMNTIGENVKIFDMKRMTGGGFRDTTRIAASPPEVWLDIVDSNKKFLLEAMEKFANQTHKVIDWIKNDKLEELEEYFRKSSKLRKRLNK